MSTRKTDFIIRTLLEDKTAGFASIKGGISGLTQSMRGVNGEFEKLTKKAGKLCNINHFKSLNVHGIREALGVGGLLSSVGSAFSLMTAGEFQSEIEKMKVSIDERGKSLDELTELAKDLGIKTQFTHKEAAEAMKFLGAGGWNSNQVFDAAPVVLDLTGASRIKLSNVGMEDVAKSLADSMNAFNIPSSFARDFGDQLSFAFSRANQDFRQLMESVQKFSAVANTSGIKHTEALAITMALADKGAKASEAGTALSSFLATLQNLPAGARKVIDAKHIPKNEYAEFLNVKTGKVNRFLKIFELFEKYKFTPGEISEVMGKEAGKYLVSLVDKDVLQKVRRLQNEMEVMSPEVKGRTKFLNDASLKGLMGKLELLSSAIDGLAVKFGDMGLLPLAENIVSIMAAFVDKIGNLPPSILGPLAFGVAALGAIFSVRFFTGLLGRIGAIANMGGLFSKIFSKTTKGFGPLPFRGIASFGNGFVVIIRALKIAFAPLFSIQTLIVGLIAAVGYIAWFLVKNWAILKEKFPILETIRVGLSDFMDSVFGFFSSLIDSVITLFEKIKSSVKQAALWLLGDEQNKLGIKFNPFFEPAPKPRDNAHDRFDQIEPRKEASEKKIKVVISGEKMPHGVSVRAQTGQGRKFDLPVGMALEFSG